RRKIWILAHKWFPRGRARKAHRFDQENRAEEEFLQMSGIGRGLGRRWSRSIRPCMIPSWIQHSRLSIPTSMCKRRCFLLLRGVFFGLGVVGVLVPGIPATPFLLLTRYCLLRSSPRLDAMLLRSRVFAPLLVDWQLQRGARKRVKVVSIVIVAFP